MSNRELDFTRQQIDEAIQAQAISEGNRTFPVAPIVTPMLAKPHTPIYRMHRYYARRPHNVFSSIIKHYTEAGNLILDPFCGGGVTVVESLKLRRKVVGVDLNPLATWVTKNEVRPIDIDRFKVLYSDWQRECELSVDPLYNEICTKCGKDATALWFEWSNVLRCSACGENVVLANATKTGKGTFKCTNSDCGALLKSSKSSYARDFLLAKVVLCNQCGEQLRVECSEADREAYNEIAKNEKRIAKKESLDLPTDPFPDMDRARDDNIFARGVQLLTDLITARQRIALGRIRKAIPTSDPNDPEVDALWHLFSSVLRFTNKFVFQSEGWQGGKPIEWAGHTYWLPFQYVELNPIPILAKRFAAFKSGLSDQSKSIGSFCQFPKGKKPVSELASTATCWLLTQSSHKLPLLDGSVDAVKTDPPFGGNVQYGELSDFYLSWVKSHLGLDSLPDKNSEAIETRNQGFTGAKDRDFYEDMLYKVFRECRRVIKSNGWMVLTFHNREIGVWMALHRAALRAGFRLPTEKESQNRGMIYQPPVDNYTHTYHQRAAGSMLGDFILSFKPTEPLDKLESIKAQLSIEEERGLRDKVEEIIRYHGGADETTLMTGLVPYLHERSLLHRLAKYDLKSLLLTGSFEFLPKEKKWYCKDMVGDSGEIRVFDHVKAEELVQEIIYSYLREHKYATFDELLILIYENLVNSHRPQMSTIESVLTKYCQKEKRKNVKREVFVWQPSTKPPSQIKAELLRQSSFDLDSSSPPDHNSIIETIARMFIRDGCQVHAGKTEQRKSPSLKNISARLTGLELGLPISAFKLIREIDLIAYQNNAIRAAIEVATTASTINKAVNDRFRNLLILIPNISIELVLVVKTSDLDQARAELNTPANQSIGLVKRVHIATVDQALSLEFWKARQHGLN